MFSGGLQVGHVIPPPPTVLSRVIGVAHVHAVVHITCGFALFCFEMSVCFVFFHALVAPRPVGVLLVDWPPLRPPHGRFSLPALFRCWSPTQRPGLFVLLAVDLTYCAPSMQGGTFGKLAVLTRDTKALADKVSASGGAKKVGGGDVLFAGEVPGIGTKVRTPSHPDPKNPLDVL